jgi:hypothetical protein
MRNTYRRLLVGLAIIIGIANAVSITAANPRIMNSTPNIGTIAAPIDINPIEQRPTICQIAIDCSGIDCNDIEARTPIVV